MEEWVYQLFLKTGSVDAYLLLKELSRKCEDREFGDCGFCDESRRGDCQGIQPWRE